MVGKGSSDSQTNTFIQNIILCVPNSSLASQSLFPLTIIVHKRLLAGDREMEEKRKKIQGKKRVW